jgi:hypothetical protein
MTVHIALPLTSEQATAVVVAADAFGVEPWEMAAHVVASVRIFGLAADTPRRDQ